MRDNKLRITKHLDNIDIKLKQYFSWNFRLNKRYFNVKSIMKYNGNKYYNIIKITKKY